MVHDVLITKHVRRRRLTPTTDCFLSTGADAELGVCLGVWRRRRFKLVCQFSINTVNENQLCIDIFDTFNRAKNLLSNAESRRFFQRRRQRRDLGVFPPPHMLNIYEEREREREPETFSHQIPPEREKHYVS